MRLFTNVPWVKIKGESIFFHKEKPYGTGENVYKNVDIDYEGSHLKISGKTPENGSALLIKPIEGQVTFSEIN